MNAIWPETVGRELTEKLFQAPSSKPNSIRSLQSLFFVDGFVDKLCEVLEKTLHQTYTFSSSYATFFVSLQCFR